MHSAHNLYYNLHLTTSCYYIHLSVSHLQWAPDVFWNENYINKDGSKGAYMMYYSVSSTYCRSAIGYAVSKQIDRGYQYAGTLVYSGFTKVSARDKNSNIDKIYTNTNIYGLIANGTLKDGYNNNWSLWLSLLLLTTALFPAASRYGPSGFLERNRRIL